MKKLFLALALAFCAATVSAQGWGLGARVGAALQLQGEYTLGITAEYHRLLETIFTLE